MHASLVRPVIVLFVAVVAGSQGLAVAAPGDSPEAGCSRSEGDLSAALGLTLAVCPQIPEIPEIPAIPATPEMPPVGGPAAGTCLPVELDRCEAWVSAPYDGPAGGSDLIGDGWVSGNTIATSPDGAVVFAAGQSRKTEFGTLDDIVVLALDAVTGQRRWVRRYTGSNDRPDAVIRSLVAGPTGVYLTGYTWNEAEPGVGFTVAYHPTTGDVLWEVAFPGVALDSAVSDDGSRVFVTGENLVMVDEPWGEEPRVAAITVAYDAQTGLDPETGAPVWTRTFIDETGAPLVPWRMDSAGDRVTVAASRLNETGGTIAFDMTTFDAVGENEGETISRLQVPVNGVLPAGLVLSPDGSRAFVTHASGGSNAAYTVAVDTGPGTVRWTARFAGAGWTIPWYFHPLDVSPDGRTVYLAAFVNEVFGYGGGTATLAYDADTGTQRWLARSSFATNTCLGLCGPSVSVNPKTGQIVVANSVLAVNRSKAATWAYNPDGDLEWMHVSGDRPQGASVQFEDAGTGWWAAIVHAPSGNRVYVGGQVLMPLVDSNSSPDASVSAFDTT